MSLWLPKWMEVITFQQFLLLSVFYICLKIERFIWPLSLLKTVYYPILNPDAMLFGVGFNLFDLDWKIGMYMNSISLFWLHGNYIILLVRIKYMLGLELVYWKFDPINLASCQNKWPWMWSRCFSHRHELGWDILQEIFCKSLCILLWKPTWNFAL